MPVSRTTPSNRNPSTSTRKAGATEPKSSTPKGSKRTLAESLEDEIQDVKVEPVTEDEVDDTSSEEEGGLSYFTNNPEGDADGDVPMTTSDSSAPSVISVSSSVSQASSSKKRKISKAVNPDDESQVSNPSPPPPPPSSSSHRNAKGKGKERARPPSPEEDHTVTPTQKPKPRPRPPPTIIPIPTWMSERSRGVEQERSRWEWAPAGHPKGAYDILDIMPKEVPKKDQMQEMTNFLGSYIPDLGQQEGASKGMWACLLGGEAPNKSEITKEAVKEVLGDDYECAPLQRTVWSLVYSPKGKPVAPKLLEKALFNRTLRRAVVFRSLVPPFRRHLRINEVK